MSVCDEERLPIAVAVEDTTQRGRSSSPKYPRVKRRTKAATTVVAATTEQPPVAAEWFGRTVKMIGRDKIRVNDSTDEADILSLAIHNSIATDEDVSKFVLNDRTLTALTSAAKSSLSRPSKKKTPATATTADDTVVTRYYNDANDLPEEPDPRVAYHPSPADKPCRWAIRNFLVPALCSLLDETQRSRALIGIDIGPGGTDVLTTSGATMVTFRNQRRDLTSIPLSEIEAAEEEILSSKSVALMRELVCIRKMLHANCEKGIGILCVKLREAEGNAHAEKMLRVKDIAAKDSEIASAKASRAFEISALLTSHSRLIETIKDRTQLNHLENDTRRELIMIYFDGCLTISRRLTVRLRQIVPSAVISPAVDYLARGGGGIGDQQQELEDARLEIKRLKDDLRTQLVPKPKAHRKVKDPDLHMATDAEIRNAVTDYLSTLFGGNGKTPSVSSSSTVAARANRQVVGVGSSLTVSLGEYNHMKEREIIAARELKRLSRLREVDIGNAESSSDQLIEVVEALSRLLTTVSATVDDVSIRRTTILNHMRSMALHSRGITSLISEHPHLLSLAHRMNRERRALVTLTPMRAIINVANLIVKNLMEAEKITPHESSFSVLSLEEAAEQHVWNLPMPPPPTEEDIPPPLPTGSSSIGGLTPPIMSGGKPTLLTQATLHRHTAATTTRQDDDRDSSRSSN